MDPDDQRRLRKNHVFLVQNLRAEDLVDYLYQEGVLSDDNCEEVVGEKLSRDKNKALLKILPRKGPHAFGVLLNALRETTSGFIADKLESTDLSEASYELDSPTTDQPDSSLTSQTQQQSPYHDVLRDIQRQMSHQNNEMERLKGESVKLKQRMKEMEEDAIRKGYTESEINEKIIEIMEKSTTGLPSTREVQTSENVHDEPEGSLTDSSDDLPRDAIRIEARLIAKDIVNYVGRKSKDPPPNKHCRTMRNTVDELLVKYESFFKQVYSKLGINEQTTYRTFESIANEVLFGIINWGRIVAVYAFSGSMARFCVERGMENLVDKIGEFTGKYAARMLCDWIMKNGGWDKFDEHFPDTKSLQDKQWNQLLWPVVGLGALAGLMQLLK